MGSVLVWFSLVVGRGGRRVVSPERQPGEGGVLSAPSGVRGGSRGFAGRPRARFNPTEPAEAGCWTGSEVPRTKLLLRTAARRGGGRAACCQPPSRGGAEPFYSLCWA